MKIPASKTVVRCKEKAFHSNSSQMLRDTPQRNYRICILGDVQISWDKGQINPVSGTLNKTASTSNFHRKLFYSCITA